MNMNQRWSVLGAGTLLAAAVLTLGGCAAEGPVKPAGLEQKIEAARTRADHQKIAAIYERQAGVDKEAMERHRNLARAYERGWVRSGPPVGGASSVRRENQSFVAHCENLARLYQQTAEEILALAREHRWLAAETKDRSAMRLTIIGLACGYGAAALARRDGNRRPFVIDAACRLE